MWNTFKYTIITLLKEQSILVWVILFPLIMSTLFNVMFSGIDEASSFKAIPTAIVKDANYKDNDTFSKLIDILSEPGDDQVLDAHFVDSTNGAQKLLEEGTVRGYYQVDAFGEPMLFAAASNELGIRKIDATILKDIIDNFVRAQAAIDTIANNKPELFASTDFLEAVESFYESTSFTTQISITANKASGSVRYFYALLGFASIMAATIGMIAITRTQANLSALGARRSMSANSRAKTMIATLLASWLLSFACLMLAFLYMRFVLGAEFGGRDGACVFGLFIASLMTTAFGSFIGSIPKLGERLKSGILTAITCFLALFVGLYGPPSQNLADSISRDAPMLQLMNPSKQVSDLFYSLYFYDTYDQFFSTVKILLVTTAILFFAAMILMRRQRYASI